MRWLGQRRLLLLVAILALVATACRVDADLEVEMAPDGTGSVTVNAVFDAAATEALDGLATEVFLGDVTDAGWTLNGPEVTDDGGVSISARKAVPSADALGPILDEILGPGVFTNVELATVDNFGERTQTLSYELDLTSGWQLFADAALTQSLGGEPFGVPIDQLTDNRTLDDIIDLEVTSTLRAESGEPSTGIATPTFDGQQPTVISVTTVVEEPFAQILRWIAWALASLALLAFVLALTGVWLQRRSERLAPAPTPKKLTSRIPESRTPSTEPAATAASSPALSDTEAPVRLVVVDPLAVLFEGIEEPAIHVLQFVRDNDGQVRADEIVDVLDDALRGRSSTDELWTAAGLAGDTPLLNAAFVDGRQLRKEGVSFLKELARRRIPIAAISNDTADWSSATRQRGRLSTIWPWLASADVGATKPDTGLFERLRRETGVNFAHCLYIDTNVEHLDAARELGMRTALYVPGRTAEPELSGHVVVRDLSKLAPKARAVD